MSRRPLELTLLPFACAVLLGLAYSFGDVTRDCALTCNVGYRFAPFAFLAVVAAAVPFLSLQLRLRERWGAWRWQVRSSLLAAASFVGFRALTWVLIAGSWNQAARYAYLAFYVWLELTSAVLIANLFALAERLEDTGATVERVAAAVLAGALGGSWIAMWVNRWLAGLLGGRFELARDHLLLGMSLAILVNGLLVRRMERLAGRGAAEPGPVKASLATAWAWVRADARLLRLAGFFFLSGAATVSLTFISLWIVSEQTAPNRVDLFARFYVGINAFSFALAAFGAQRLIRRFGIVGVLLSLPALLVLGTASLAVFSMLWVVLGLRIVSEAISSAIHEPATERLLGTLDPERADVLGPFLDSMATRAGEAAASLLMIALSFFVHASVKLAIGVCLALHAAWLVSVLALRGARR